MPRKTTSAQAQAPAQPQLPRVYDAQVLREKLVNTLNSYVDSYTAQKIRYMAQLNKEGMSFSYVAEWETGRLVEAEMKKSLALDILIVVNRPGNTLLDVLEELNKIIARFKDDLLRVAWANKSTSQMSNYISEVHYQAKCDFYDKLQNTVEFYQSYYTRFTVINDCPTPDTTTATAPVTE